MIIIEITFFSWLFSLEWPTLAMSRQPGMSQDRKKIRKLTRVVFEQGCLKMGKLIFAVFLSLFYAVVIIFYNFFRVWCVSVLVIIVVNNYYLNL